MKNDTNPTENTAKSGNKSKPLLQAVFLAPYLPFKLQGHYLLSDVVNTPKDELRDKLLTIDNFDFFLNINTDLNNETTKKREKEVSTKINGSELEYNLKILYDGIRYLSQIKFKKFKI